MDSQWRLQAAPPRPGKQVDQRRGRAMLSWRNSDVQVKKMNTMALIMGHLDKDVLKQFKKDVKEKVLTPTVQEIKSRAQGSPTPQTSIAIKSVKINNKAQPSIVAGGTMSLASQLLYGSEFGQKGSVTKLLAKKGKYMYWRQTTRQFKAGHNPDGYWFFPTVHARFQRNVNAIGEIRDDAIANAMRDGGVT